jgi:hypothetical protein
MRSYILIFRALPDALTDRLKNADRQAVASEVLPLDSLDGCDYILSVYPQKNDMIDTFISHRLLNPISH